MAPDAVRIFGQFALHLVQAEQDRAGVVQQAFAGGCEIDAARVAVEQGRVQGRFQVRQPLAHGRGRDELALRGLADRAEFAHRHK